MKISVRQTIINVLTRALQKPLLRFISPLPLARAYYAANASMIGRRPRGYRQIDAVLKTADHSVKASWVDLGGSTSRGVILYLHGGGFIHGTLRGYCHVVPRLADMAGMALTFVHYRLAPEHPFPAAPQDALTAYQALLQQGHDPARIAVVGDSTGGNLAAGLILQIKQRGLPMPAAVALLCPVTDLTNASPSMTTNRRSDMLVNAPWIERSWRAYLQGQDPSQELASPLYGDFTGAPPTMILVAVGEMLYDDSIRLAEKLRSNSVDVRLDEWENVPHVWHMAAGITPEAEQGIRDVAKFLTDTLD